MQKQFSNLRFRVPRAEYLKNEVLCSSPDFRKS